MPNTRRNGLARRTFAVLREPMFLLLGGATALYVLLGDISEALALFSSVFVVVGITLYQAGKSERALEALRDLSTTQATVVRDGTPTRIDARRLVVGDAIALAEGDRVPADARLIECTGLGVDESLVTGELLAVDKQAMQVASVEEQVRVDHVYSGTLVVHGHGAAEVVATGARTAVGRIGESLRRTVTPRSPMQRDVDRAVIAFAAAGLCAVVVALYVTSRGGWVDALLAGTTLAIANVPEEFPVVLTIFPALGAWRLARQQVLTRRMPAIETLGAITRLCVDKTGTLTENRMRIAALRHGASRWDAAGGSAIGADFRLQLEHAALACRVHPVGPMERAIAEAAAAFSTGGPRALVREYPRRSHHLRQHRASDALHPRRARTDHEDGTVAPAGRRAIGVLARTHRLP